MGISYTSKMYIYKDVFCGDELFSDTYPIKIVDDVLYEVTGKHISRALGDVQLEGATESGVDVVLNNRLVETGFGKKSDYVTYLKGYMKKVVDYLEANNKKDQVDTFKNNINKVMKPLLGKFSDLQFFTGESMVPDAMIMLLEYRDVDGEETPILMCFKHGIEEEKV